MTNKRSKVSRNFYYLLILPLIALTAITLQVKGFTHPHTTIGNNLTQARDTVPLQIKGDTIPGKRPINDSILNKNDSTRAGLIDTTIKQKVDTFNFKTSRDSIDAPIDYKATDSMVLMVDTKQILLYGRSEVKYTDVTLAAPYIALDQTTQMVTARMDQDSIGKIAGMAKLTQGGTTTVSDSIRFNFESQKGITYNSFFQQDEIYNFAEKVKKVDPQTFYAARGRFTTCNLDTPHFAFRFKKAKFVNKKVAVTGPVHPEFEQVPVPLYLPFGIFPLATGRRSGIIPPQFTVTEDFGIGLEGFGYYKIFNDYLDAKAWADLYSYGSWRVNLSPSYRMRYRYSGAFTISYQNTKFAFKGDPDYSQTKSFFVTWNHTRDSKARPGTSFSASVNAGSSKYLSLVPNSALVNAGGGSGTGVGASGGYLQPINFTNQLQSSISYQKSWIGKPYNLTVNLNHQQNTQRRIVNLNLPDIGFVVNTVYPFQPKEMVGAGKWYEKLGIGYNGSYKSLISFYDTAFQWKQLIDTLQWGASHDVPIQLSLPALGPFQIAPNFSYRERWYAQKFIRQWNNSTNKLDTTIQKGFYSAREISMGISLNTAIFSTFQSKKKNGKVEAIRHTMRPQFGINYKPDLVSQYWYRTKVDTLNRQMLFSYFDGSIYGPFSAGRSGGISFGIDNNIEAKVRSKSDTGEAESKKVKILDGFGISGGYNFLADSFKLSTFNIYARSYLFDKINITANATLDPYKTDPFTGQKRDIYAWQGGDGFSLGSIVNGSLNISTTLQSKKKDENKKSIDEQIRDSGEDQLTQDQMMQQLEYVRRNPAEFTDFNIPWSVNIGLNVSFARVLQPDYTFSTQFSSSLNFNGDFNLTPKWKVGANGYYDLRALQMQSFTMFISRDLHCWQMSINVTPIGLYRSFNISISPKSSLLRDLKVNRTRYFYTE